MNIIIDIDNTLCINTKRFSLARTENGKIDLNILYKDELMIEDAPNYPMINLVQMYKKEGNKIIIITSRPSFTKKITKEWLKKFNIEYDKLFMRSKKDHYVKPNILKKKIYETYIKDKIFCAYDDEDQIINMWISLGIPSFKVYGV